MAELLTLVGAIVTLGFWWSVPSVTRLAAHNPPTSAFIEMRKQAAAASKKPWRLQWTWRRLDEISPFMRHAVVLAEDDTFWRHDGFDMDALEAAAESALEAGVEATQRGGSTITQQLAKNLYLSPDRTYIRKARELLIAMRLERDLSKERILELYLNLAEWGDGIFGIEAASRRYYKRSARELSPAQAARLAVALPNPFRRNPSVRAAWLGRRAARLVRSMHAQRYISSAQRDLALAELGVGLTAPAP
ncbi:MAG: monofunctional biosynthetic peptidoglycan transglycosylase [Myxococcales bacterium]|nr:monofunctional biosynthetic peptidoglycan transglycosylase [Myxococcales bacterium]